ncbi:hypothetical protein O1M63_26200 [Streptomyces mirabilis]|nr:hypothetical protein [Streptomyces mirabilis]
MGAHRAVATPRRRRGVRPDTDAVVQDELAANAERGREKQLEEKRLQEEEAEAARHAALAPTSCATPCCAPSPAPASWTR